MWAFWSDTKLRMLLAISSFLISDIVRFITFEHSVVVFGFLDIVEQDIKYTLLSELYFSIFLVFSRIYFFLLRESIYCKVHCEEFLMEKCFSSQQKTEYELFYGRISFYSQLPPVYTQFIISHQNTDFYRCHNIFLHFFLLTWLQCRICS